MHSLITQLFKKKGIESVKDLSKEERDIFDNYEYVLSKKELKVEDIKTFLGQQLDIIESKWRDYDVSQERKNELLPYHTVYKALFGAINSPEQEKVAMEKYLLNIINQ